MKKTLIFILCIALLIIISGCSTFLEGFERGYNASKNKREKTEEITETNEILNVIEDITSRAPTVEPKTLPVTEPAAEPTTIPTTEQPAATTVSKTQKQTEPPTTVAPTTEKPTEPPIQIKFTSVITEVKRNEIVKITVQGEPNTKYKLSVKYASGHVSEAGGLGKATSDSNGFVSWEWKIGGKTNPGKSEFKVTDGKKSETYVFYVVESD